MKEENGLEEKSLEELAKEVLKGGKSPLYLELREVEARARDLGFEVFEKTGSSHKKLIGHREKVDYSPRQRGKEKVISRGVLEDIEYRTSNILGVPYQQIRAFIEGRGKLYKKYKRKFLEEYFKILHE